MVALGRWFTHSFLLTLKFLSGYVHRSTLPQSALAGCQLPQRGSREGLCHSPDRPEAGRLAGDFHRPYGGRVPFIPPFGNRSVAGAIHPTPGGGNQSSSSFRTAMKASEGTETVPKVRIRFLPSFCFSSSFFFRVMSPP